MIPFSHRLVGGLSLFFLLVFLSGNPELAGEGNPETPSERPPATVLSETITWTVELDKSTFQTRRRLRLETIQGMRLANQAVFFGEPEKLVAFSGRTIKPDGTVVEIPPDLRQEVIVEKRPDFEFRQLKFSFPAVEPGAILEWEFSLERDDLRPWPWWEIQGPLPVLESRFIVRARAIHALPHKVDSYQRSPITPYCTSSPMRKEGGFEVFEHICRNVPPFQPEPLSPPEKDVRLRVMFTWNPEQWLKKGPGSVWGTYTDEFWFRLRGLLDGGTEVRRRARQEIRKTGAPQERLERLGRFLRKNIVVNSTEVFSGTDHVQGAPKSATDVLTRGQGAILEVLGLAKALAEASGFQAHLLEAGDNQEVSFRMDIPDLDQGRHWMLQLIDGNQSFFLDPACRHCHPGFPEARYCGGKLSGLSWHQPSYDQPNWEKWVINIPPVGSDRNTLKREERIVLDGSGDAVLAGSITWGGQPEQEERDAIEPLKEDARTDRLFSGESGSLSDTSGSYSDPDNMDEPLKATYQFRRASSAILDGEHLILLPRDVFSRELPLPIVEHRTYPLWWPRPFSAEEKAVYVLPPGFSVGTLPEAVDLSGAGIKFKSIWSKGEQPNELRWEARLSVDTVKIPVKDYPAAREVALGMRRALETGCPVKR